MAVEAELLDVLAGTSHRIQIGVEAVHEVLFADVQRRGKPAVVTPEVHNQAAFDTGGI